MQTPLKKEKKKKKIPVKGGLDLDRKENQLGQLEKKSSSIVHTYKRGEDREGRRESRGVSIASRLALGASVSRDLGFPFWGSAFFFSTFRLVDRGQSTSSTMSRTMLWIRSWSCCP